MNGHAYEPEFRLPPKGTPVTPPKQLTHLLHFSLEGRNPADGVPLRWLESFVQESIHRVLVLAGPTTSEQDKARVEREVDSALVFGVEHLRSAFVDEQTEIEALRERAATADRLREEILQALGADTSLAAQKVRTLLGANPTAFGSGVEGTQAPAAPAPTPTVVLESTPIDERARVGALLTNSGFVLPDHARALRTAAVNWQTTESLIEALLDNPIGTISKEIDG